MIYTYYIYIYTHGEFHRIVFDIDIYCKSKIGGNPMVSKSSSTGNPRTSCVPAVTFWSSELRGSPADGHTYG